MKRLQLLALSLVVLFMLTACVVTGGLAKEFAQIKPGQSEAQVVAILGEPYKRSFEYNRSCWHYQEVFHYVGNSWTKDWELRFVDGRVVSLREAQRQEKHDEPKAEASIEIGNIRLGTGSYASEARTLGSTRITRPGGFAAYLEKMERSFSSERLALIRRCGEWVSYLDVEQTKRLLSLFSFSDERYAAFVLLAPYIVYGGSADSLVELFPHRRQEVSKLIQDYGTILPSERDFEEFYNTVRSEPFDNDKFRVLELGCRRRSFTINQCIRMMQIFTFDRERLKVLGYMHDRVIDLEHVYKLLEQFSFRSNQDEVRKMFGLED